MLRRHFITRRAAERGCLLLLAASAACTGLIGAAPAQGVDLFAT